MQTGSLRYNFVKGIVMSVRLWITGLFVLITAFVQASEFYVSPNGSDTDLGTKSQPFATLDHTQKAVRAVLKTTSGPMTVYLREGTYFLSKPLTFGIEDSGRENATVT